MNVPDHLLAPGPAQGVDPLPTEFLEISTPQGPINIEIKYNPGKGKVVHIYGLASPHTGFNFANHLSPIIRGMVQVGYFPGYASWHVKIPEHLGSHPVTSVIQTVRELAPKFPKAEPTEEDPLGSAELDMKGAEHG